MNSEIRKRSKPHLLALRFTNKVDLRIGKKVVALSNLSIYYTWKNIKTYTITINLKSLHQHGMII